MLFVRWKMDQNVAFCALIVNIGQYEELQKMTPNHRKLVIACMLKFATFYFHNVNPRGMGGTIFAELN